MDTDCDASFRYDVLFRLWNECEGGRASTKSNRKEPEVTILLERMYVDGEVSEEIFTEKVADLEKFYSSIKNGSLLIVMMYKLYYKRKLTIFLRY